MTPKLKQTWVEIWNQLNPVGSPVVMMLDNGSVHFGKVRNPATVDAAGQCVVWVTGLSGYYSCSRVWSNTDAIILQAALVMREECVNKLNAIAGCQRGHRIKQAWWDAADTVKEISLLDPVTLRQPFVASADQSSGLGSIDGVPVETGDKFLMVDNKSHRKNGVYIVTAVGDEATPFGLTREADMYCGSKRYRGRACTRSKGHKGPHQHGKGKPWPNLHPCSNCKGRGAVISDEDLDNYTKWMMAPECSKCTGQGEIEDKEA